MCVKDRATEFDECKKKEGSRGVSGLELSTYTYRY